MSLSNEQKLHMPVNPKVDHSDLCLLAYKFLKANNFGVVFRDGFKAFTSTGEQPDALGFRSNTSCLIEVKVSRADFLADRKKPFRIDPALGVGKWRFYLSPPDVISIQDLPPGWGLLTVISGRVKKVSGWPPNSQWNKAPFSDQTNTIAEQEIMYSALRRMQIHGHLDSIYDGLYGRCSVCHSLLTSDYLTHPSKGRICKTRCSNPDSNLPITG